MAKELEYKLQLAEECQLFSIMASAEVRTLLDSPWREIPMKTTYYDNNERLFSRMHWTLRHRREGDASIVCLKTPNPLPHVRNEWQVEAETLDENSIAALIDTGAPQALQEHAQSTALQPICGAEFLRRCAMLRFPDGSRAELALDQGRLFGEKGSLPILELELELYEGDPSQMQKLTVLLCKLHGLSPQPMSKFARAKTLQERE